jgi:hypothetical protein
MKKIDYLIHGTIFVSLFCLIGSVVVSKGKQADEVVIDCRMIHTRPDLPVVVQKACRQWNLEQEKTESVIWVWRTYDKTRDRQNDA